MRDALTKEELEILRQGAKNPTTKSIIRVFIQHRVPVGEETESVNKTHIDWQRLQLNVIGKETRSA